MNTDTINDPATGERVLTATSHIFLITFHGDEGSAYGPDSTGHATSVPAAMVYAETVADDYFGNPVTWLDGAANEHGVAARGFFNEHAHHHVNITITQVPVFS